MVTPHQIASQTLPLLEHRFRRIDYALTGHPDVEGPVPRLQPSGATATATARLRHLERQLQSLASRSPAAADVLRLHARHPALFHPTSSAASSSTLPAASLAALVSSHASLYTRVTNDLTLLSDQHAPGTAEAAALVELLPRIERVRMRQEQQAREFAELRSRSAELLEGWYEGGVLGMGGRWAEWEERVREMEILVRRREAARRRAEVGMP